MKKLLGIVVLGLLLSGNAYSKEYKVNEIVENKFILSKKFEIDLSDGKWILAEKVGRSLIGITYNFFTLVKVENDKVVEAIEIAQWNTAGILEGHVNSALYEILFKNKYHGCYERPEYTILKSYVKGNTHNCFWVGHRDVNKHVYNPVDPERKTAYSGLKKWLELRNFSLPNVALFSEHSYFSRLVGGKWYVIAYSIDPRILNAPENKYITEETSEYHKYNIDNHPQHKKIMKKWISISAQRHIDFESNVKAHKRHKLNLTEISP